MYRPCLLLASVPLVLTLHGCSTDDTGQDGPLPQGPSPPPVAVLARVPDRLATLEDGMTEEQIFGALGLGPWREYLEWRCAVSGGIGGFTHSYFLRDPGYVLSITTRPTGKTEVAFKSPDSDEWVSRELESPPGTAWAPEPGSGDPTDGG